jgi:chromate transporter
MKELWDIFITFCKVGALTFGGGYAMLPILQREVVNRKGGVTDEEVIDYFAIGQCLPGIIAANTANFIGQKHKGAAGGVAATLGVAFPSFVVICVIAAFIQNFSDLAVVQNAFAGIRVCVCVLIFNAVVKLWKRAMVDKTALVIFAAVLAGSLALDLSPIVFVLLSGIAGVLIRNPWRTVK